MKLSFYLPRWIAKRIFPKTYRSIERRTALTGRAGVSIYQSKGGLIRVNAEGEREK